MTDRGKHVYTHGMAGRACCAGALHGTTRAEAPAKQHPALSLPQPLLRDHRARAGRRSSMLPTVGHATAATVSFISS